MNVPHVPAPPTTAAPAGRVICLGEAMVLLAAQDGLPLAWTEHCGVHIAGAESNVALYLADAGLSVSWLSAVGTDPFGDRIVNYLARNHVDTSLVHRDPSHPTGVFFKNQDAGGTTVHYYRKGSAASRLSPANLAPLRELHATGAVLAVLHLSGITAALSETCLALSRSALKFAKDSGITVSFDVNFRPGLWAASTAAPVLQALANQSDIVLVGLDEAQELWGCENPEDVRALLPDAGEIVIKDGANGATWLAGGESRFVPAPVVEVVEVVGAGDAFAAGFLAARLSGEDIAGQLLAGHHFAARAMSSSADFRSIEEFCQTP